MTKQKNWNLEQPHSPKTGQFTTKRYADKNPEKVTWVKVD